MNLLHRAVGAASLVTASALLAGCVPSTGSVLSVIYELDGREYTANLRPHDVGCTDTLVIAFPIGDSGTTGTLIFRVGRDGEPSSGTGGMGVGPNSRTGDYLLTFVADEVDISIADGIVTVPETPAVVRIYQKDDGADLEPEDADLAEGTVSAHLRCEPDA